MAHAVVPDARPDRRRWWVLLGLLLVAALAAAVALVTRDGSDTPRPGSSPSPTRGITQAPVRPVASFSGSGNETTATFGAALNWELRWTAEPGSGFTVELLNSSGASLGKVVTAGKRTSGSTFVSQAGSFKLRVTSKQAWTVSVRSRPTTK